MDKVIHAYNYIMSRLNEPSTHSAVAAVMLYFGVQLDAGIVHDFITTSGVLFGAMGIFVPESK